MDFFDVLVRYEIALWNAVDQELSRQGQIDLGRLHALRVLERHAGRARVQDLSDEIGITVGAASKLVDRLERDGLTMRTANPDDRRSSLVSLTVSGRQALASAMAVCRPAVARAVGEEDVEPLTGVLRQLLARLDSGSGLAA